MAMKTGGSGDTFTVITCFRCGNQVNQPQGTRRTICPYCGGFFVQDGEESAPRRTAPQGKPPPASGRQPRRSRPSDPALPSGRGSRGDIRDDQFPRRSSADSSTSSVRRQVLAEVPRLLTLMDFLFEVRRGARCSDLCHQVGTTQVSCLCSTPAVEGRFRESLISSRTFVARVPNEATTTPTRMGHSCPLCHRNPAT